MRRAWLLLLLLAWASGCTKTRACKSGTVFLTVSYAGGATTADQLRLVIAVNGGAAVTSTLSHPAGASSGTVEVDFTGAYPTGATLTLIATALKGGSAVGSGAASLVAAPGCTSGQLNVGGGGGDMGTMPGLNFTTGPSTLPARARFSPAVQITIKDASGNTASGATDAVTIALGNNPSNASLAGTLTVNAVAGVASFPDLRLDNVGTGFTLIASAASYPSVTSAPFDVTAPSWTAVRSGLEGGSVSAIAVDPTNASIMYAAASSAGVFKSTDGGVTWMPSSRGISNLFVLALAVDPVNHLNVYAGADSFNGGDSVYKSIDGGMTWSGASTGMPADEIDSLTVDPATPQVVYAGTLNNGVYKTFSGGTNWAKAGAATYPSAGGGYGLAMDPTNSQILYVSSNITGGSQGVWKSTDGGATWTHLANQPGGIPRAMVVARSNHLVVYADNGGGVSKSGDGGATWVAVNTGVASQIITRLAVDPANENNVYAGAIPFNQSGGCFATTNGGGAWYALNSGLGDLYVQSLTFVGGNLFAGTYLHGIFKRASSDSAFSATNRGLTGYKVSQLAAGPTGTVYAALYGGGVYKTVNSGGNWAAANTGLTGWFSTAIGLDPAMPSVVFAGSVDINVLDQRGDVWRSSDGATSWNASAAMKLKYESVRAISVFDATHAYVGGNSLYATSDGTTWAATMTQPGQRALALAVDPKNSMTVYAGGYDAGVFKTVDGGKTWAATNGGLPTGPSPQMQSITVDPTDSNTVYLGTLQGAYKSSDGGMTWAAASSGLGSKNVTAVLVDPALPRVLYAATNGAGVFRSTDAGVSWTAINTGLDTAAVNALAVDPGDPALVYAGTFGSGVFKTTLP